MFRVKKADRLHATQENSTMGRDNGRTKLCLIVLRTNCWLFEPGIHIFLEYPQMINAETTKTFLTLSHWSVMLCDCPNVTMKDHGMTSFSRLIPIVIASCAIAACIPARYLKGGIYRSLDDNLTIVGLTENPGKYLDKEIVFSVRYYKKGDLPCPLGEGFANFIIADRVSYITLNKVWMKKDKAQTLDSLKEMETIVMKAKVFRVDTEKDPNLEALEIVRE